jgi:hypothetical protein
VQVTHPPRKMPKGFAFGANIPHAATRQHSQYPLQVLADVVSRKCCTPEIGPQRARRLTAAHSGKQQLCRG